MPVLLATLAAVSFALGATLQQRGTLETSAGEGDPRFLIQILKRPAWLVGAGLQASGWVLQAIALDRGSLIAVQSICALSLVFALPFGARLTAQRIDRRSVIGAVLTVFGIVAFLVTGSPDVGAAVPETTTLVAVTILGAVTMVGLAWLAGSRRGAFAAVLFAAGAGVAFGMQAAATKVFVADLGGGLWSILTLTSTYLLIGTALAGFALQQSALKTGFLAPSLASSNASTLVTSVVLGVAVFGESIASPSGSSAIAVAALATAVVGVIILATPNTVSPRDQKPTDDSAA